MHKFLEYGFDFAEIFAWDKICVVSPEQEKKLATFHGFYPCVIETETDVLYDTAESDALYVKTRFFLKYMEKHCCLGTTKNKF